MAITLHASSPALVTTTANGTLATGTFSPPANSFLVAMVSALDDSTNGPTVTSGGGLTWTRRVTRGTSGDGTRTQIWTAPCAAGASNITVTLASAGVFGGVVFASAMKVDVFTDVDLASPVGATGQNSSTSASVNVTGYSSTAAGSRGVIAASDTAVTGLPSSSDDESAFDMSNLSGLFARKAANTATSGSNVTFNLVSGGASPEWEWVALELKPGASDASATLATVTATTTVPAPDAGAGAGPEPATVTATTTAPAPTAQGDANATPATVTATVAVPAPAVTTDSATVVDLSTVTGTAAVPAPAVTTDISLTVGPVEAAVTVWPLDVVAEFDASAVLPHVAVTVEASGVVASVPPLPGDQLDGQPGQIEFGGFVLGRGTPYRWKTLTGWRGKPPIDSGNVPRSSRHGSWAGRPLLQERVITWTGLLRAPRADVEAAVTALELALPVYSDERPTPLVINDLGTPYLIYGRIDRDPLVVDQQLRLGLGQLSLQWVCSDPRRYNLLATGVTVPAGGQETISNGGNIETHPLLVVHGPAADPPSVLNATTNKLVEFNVTLADGQTLVIDCDLGNATIDGESVMGQLAGGAVHPTDFVLDRGGNVISATAETDVLYRDAWA